jgi:hypothetical protein
VIKAVAHGADGPLYLFGLSDGNLERLRKGMPILVDLRGLGGVGKVCICWGETEEKLAREILSTVGAKVVVDMKNPNG